MKAGLSAREARLAEKQKLDGELTKARTVLATLRAERDSLVIGLRRGELIRKHDAKVHLGFLLTGLRQRLMSLSYALPRRLVGKNEHEIGRIIDDEVRLALRDIASWPERMADPGWSERIDADLMPAANAGNGADADEATAAQRERANTKRRQRYAKSKEG